MLLESQQLHVGFQTATTTKIFYPAQIRTGINASTKAQSSIDGTNFSYCKLRILDELNLSKGQFPMSRFQINYVVSSISGSASEHTINMRPKHSSVSVNGVPKYLDYIYRTSGKYRRLARYLSCHMKCAYLSSSLATAKTLTLAKTSDSFLYIIYILPIIVI